MYNILIFKKKVDMNIYTFVYIKKMKKKLPISWEKEDSVAGARTEARFLCTCLIFLGQFWNHINILHT